jgi:3-hydroxyisobutyryl-CoA hydrolase
MSNRFEMDYILAKLPKPYAVILDGFTSKLARALVAVHTLIIQVGGGVGLAAHAPFRIATENTVLSMPETKIGYCPDVGASFFMSRLDGELGTYLALTSDQLKGRAVLYVHQLTGICLLCTDSSLSEHGFATHFIPSRRVPVLLDRLAALEDPYQDLIDRTIEELSSERQPDEPPASFIGSKRAAIDQAFSHDSVEKIFDELETLINSADTAVSNWAKETLAVLHLRSPTSLKVALHAIRQGKEMTLLDSLQMELGIASAYCVSEMASGFLSSYAPVFSRAAPVQIFELGSPQY